ncbi:hypothetical protein N658DRAFT_15673 [Parathielavia hyrcaniae]|uniref:Secreted protein n=1 Tax=Parathielavia hyrcaniae TaxID=113614 RepID=A0AAN6T5W3_9PEZI|nr:hypothetical protein N658DRAFT_15673 [Parathielavia hyrcaniae]
MLLSFLLALYGGRLPAMTTNGTKNISMLDHSDLFLRVVLKTRLFHLTSPSTVSWIEILKTARLMRNVFKHTTPAKLGKRSTSLLVHFACRIERRFAATRPPTRSYRYRVENIGWMPTKVKDQGEGIHKRRLPILTLSLICPQTARVEPGLACLSLVGAYQKNPTAAPIINSLGATLLTSLRFGAIQPIFRQKAGFPAVPSTSSVPSSISRLRLSVGTSAETTHSTAFSDSLAPDQSSNERNERTNERTNERKDPRMALLSMPRD